MPKIKETKEHRGRPRFAKTQKHKGHQDLRRHKGHQDLQKHKGRQDLQRHKGHQDLQRHKGHQGTSGNTQEPSVTHWDIKGLDIGNISVKFKKLSANKKF